MFENLIFHQNPAIFVAIVLVLITVSVELPYRYGESWIREPRIQDEVWNALYGGLLALVAFMLGLSYAQAQARFDARREIVVKEADAIGVTWRRADQLPAPQSSAFRAILRQYTSKQLEAYERPWDRRVMNRAASASAVDRDRLRQISADALRSHPTNLGLSMLAQAVDDLIDLSDDQFAALSQHIPTSVVLFTVLLVLLGSIFTGFSFARKKGRPGVFTAIYVLTLTLVVQMIVDFDRPQSGFIRVNLEPIRSQIAIMSKLP